MDKKELTEKIKIFARELGFTLVGITSSEKVTDIEYYKSWLEAGFAGEMDYLRRNLEKREDPELLLPGTKSIICLGLNYYLPVIQNEYKVARYALGDDYHFFMKDKISALFSYIKTLVPETEGRPYVDTAPILERSLAERAGLGWIGKNTLLINPEKGSYFLLGELFINLELEHDQPVRDHCGTCSLCIDACPTGAIVEAGKLDSNLCLSYLTIEAKQEIPEHLTKYMEGNIFGCDICQDVCPWNKKFSVPSEINEIQPREWLQQKSMTDLLQMTQEDFSRIFKNSPVKRSKLRGFLRNIIAVISSYRDKKYLSELEKLVGHEEPVVRTQAEYAIKKLKA
jgi:epoxyqueuosine reductase